MSTVPKTYISEQEYLELERKALQKSEYYKGEIFAMAGATKAHNRIVASVIGLLRQQLKGGECHFYPSDLRVYNRENTLFTYPDATVVCGKEEYLDDRFDTLLNPTVIVEVLSPSTEDYDRGTKFKLYSSIASLKNYVLISSKETMVDVYTRSHENWMLTTAKGRDVSILISAINFNLPLTEVYEQIDSF